MKCLKMSSAIIKFYLKHPNLVRTCSSCSLPNFSDLFFADEEDLVDETEELLNEKKYANQSMADIADIDTVMDAQSCIISSRRENDNE